MSSLFDDISMGQMTLPNRFVRSATYEGLAREDGTVTQELCDCMAAPAHGGTGLIITGHAYVAPEGKAGPRQMSICSDAMVEGLSAVASAIQEGGAKAVAQIAHAGFQGIGTGDHNPVGPSARELGPGKASGAMTIGEINQAVAAFAAAARRAKEAGFDGVQIHGAHGYLISQFLSPHFNQRGDVYGGSLENRARFVLEVYDAVRDSVGAGYPVLIKLNSEDFLENGFTREEMIQVSKLLESRGIDAIEMSGGTFLSGDLSPVRKGKLKSPEDEVYYRQASEAFRKELSVPLILVGGFLSFEVAENVVKEGLADYVALSRPLIREPGLVKRWKAGNTRRATCISCNGCFLPFSRGEGLSCEVENIRAKKSKKAQQGPWKK